MSDSSSAAFQLVDSTVGNVASASCFIPPTPHPIHMKATSTACILAILVSGLLTASAIADEPRFNIVTPSTTGVPGEEARLMGFDPAGNLWVAGRSPFWGQSGVAMLSADQLAHIPLPGGGFDTGAWKVWSSLQHPIPSPYLYDMKFAADGTIWLASEGGLTRFRPNAAPGEMWFTYTPSNSPMVIPNVLSLAIDSQGVLWVCNAGVSNNGPLFKFNPATEQWTRIDAVPNPRSVAVGNNNRVFVGVSDGGFMEFDGNLWILRGGAPVLDAMLQDAQGNVWAATNNAGLWKWNGSSWQARSVGNTGTITGLGKDRDGVIYVSTWYGGVYKMINDNPVFFVDADNIPRSVIGRPNGDIWINNYGGNGTLGTVRHYTAGGQLLSRMNTYNSGLPDFFITHMKRDSSGNMWFSSPEGGLSRMLGSNGAPEAATKWRNWGNHNDGSEPYPWAGSEPMYCVFEDDNGIYWMGGNGIGRWDSNTGSFTSFWNWQNSNLGGSNNNALVKRAGTIWAGTGGSGVFWFDGGDWNNVTLSPGGYSYSPNNVKAMTVDTDGNLWVGSEYGLRKFAAGNNTTFTVYQDANSPLPNPYITDVEADPAGGIWVATGGGLARFDGSNWTVYTQASAGWPGSFVTGLTRRASDGLIAVSVQGGNEGSVSTFNGTTWTHYTTANSPLTHPQVQTVEFDGNGNLWASAYGEGVVQIMIGEAPLQLSSVVSRKTHGSSGVFDLDLPLSGGPGIECRSSNGAHSIVFTFDSPVVGGTAQATGSGAVAGSPTFSGNTMTVNLTGVADGQTVTVAVNNVTSSRGQTLTNASVTMRSLIGDTTGNNAVNASDVGQTKAHSGQAVTIENFRSDVVVNGAINASDVGLVKSRTGQTLNSR